MVELYFCDSLNEINWFFRFLTKKKLLRNVRNLIENRLEDNKLIFSYINDYTMLKFKSFALFKDNIFFYVYITKNVGISKILDILL